MAFTPETFVVCSRFPLFKASSNLWLYVTSDSLEDCLATNYFQPRRNLKNQDSPEVGDVIQLVVEHSKLAYLKIVAKTEQPYNITVARTFLENEATLLSLITALQLDKAGKVEDFVSAITDTNKGLTQVEQAEIEEKIDLAANSGRMITPQGFWYAKMDSATVAPAAEDGTNYADFSQVDGQGNPIIVTYNRVNGAWVQDQTITPPAEYDGYVPITSKIWDIPEQDGQQGGRILWNHTSKQFTPYPQIVSFDSIEITGDSTVEMPQNPSDDNIANVGFVKSTIGGARNIGDTFLTERTDNELNGAVECNGATYNTTDFTGAQNIGELLALNKVPYVSLSAYAAEIASKGWCDAFGWDGVGTTAFRVPTIDLRHQVVEMQEPTATNNYTWYRKYADGWVEQGGVISGNGSSTVFNSKVNLPVSMADTNYTLTMGNAGSGAYSSNTGTATVNNAAMLSASTNRKTETYFFIDIVGDFTVDSWEVKGMAVSTPNTNRRVMVQLAVSTTDEAVATCTGVLADVAGLKSHEVIEFQAPTAENNLTWYRKYADGWVEQGGQTESSAGNVAKNITFPIEMADTNYAVQVTIRGELPYGAPGNNPGVKDTNTTTGMAIYSGNTGALYWEVKGMMAESELSSYNSGSSVGLGDAGPEDE